MKTLCQEEHPEKRTFCWEEGFSFLPEGKRAGAVSQRQMEKLIKQSEMSCKAGILLRERVELFTKG